MGTTFAELADPKRAASHQLKLRLLPGSAHRWMMVGLPYAAVATLSLLLLPQGHPLDLAGAIIAVVLFIVACQVELHLKTGWVGCQQAAFVLMIFVVPLNAVPIVACLSLMAAQAIKRRPPLRVLRGGLCDSWYVIPPVLMLALLSPGPARWDHWPAYVLAFVLQFLFSESAAATQFWVVAERFDGRDELMPVAIDTLLTPLGLMAAMTIGSNAAAAAVMLTCVTGLLAVLGNEHRQRRTQTQRALSDPLTGLANRALFSQMMDAAEHRCRRNGQLAGLLLIDLDDFKRINDTLGHQRGDQLLVTIAHRLRSCTRAADTVARVGGDEFAVVLTEPIRPDDLQAVIRKVRDAVIKPVILSGSRAVLVGASIGAATFGDETGATQAMTLADLKLYDDKRARKAPMAPHQQDTSPPPPRRTQHR